MKLGVIVDVGVEIMMIGGLLLLICVVIVIGVLIGEVFV